MQDSDCLNRINVCLEFPDKLVLECLPIYLPVLVAEQKAGARGKDVSPFVEMFFLHPARIVSGYQDSAAIAFPNRLEDASRLDWHFFIGSYV